MTVLCVTVGVLALTWVVALALIDPNGDTVNQAQSGAGGVIEPVGVQPTSIAGTPNATNPSPASSSQVPAPVEDDGGAGIVTRVKNNIVNVARVIKNAVANVFGANPPTSESQGSAADPTVQQPQPPAPTKSSTRPNAGPAASPYPTTWPTQSPSPTASPTVLSEPPARSCTLAPPTDFGLVEAAGQQANLPTTQTTGWQGVGIATLSVFSGSATITTPGAVIDGKLIQGALVIDAPNVTITRSRIEAPTGNFAIYETADGCGLTLDHVEITAAAGAHPDRAVRPANNMVMNHVYIHGTQRGVAAANGMVVVNSYLDDFDNPSLNHASAIGSSGNVHNVIVRNNVLGCGTQLCSSAMSVYPEQGPNTDWVVTGNRFNGGGYCLYMGFNAAAGESPNTNLTVTDNSFGTKYSQNCGQYGPLASWSWSAGNVWSNNRWAAPGQAKDGSVVVPSK